MKITNETPLLDVVAYLTEHSGIDNFTNQLTSSFAITDYSIFQGGQADVYRATSPEGSVFAIKCLRQHDRKHVKHTARELSTWWKLEHDNILELSGLAVFRNCLAMVSPWAEHGTITSVVKQQPNVDRYSMCQQLAEAVKYLHKKNVVHGDIKGANVLVASDGTIKLTDFGLAILHDQTLQFSHTDLGGGTARWMAPELFGENAQRTRETDVYAMGMTMLEIMTGEVPFPELDSFWSLVKAVSQDRLIPSVVKLQSESTSPRAQLMIGILYRCWRYNPKERATAREVAGMVGFLGPV